MTEPKRLIWGALVGQRRGSLKHRCCAVAPGDQSPGTLGDHMALQSEEDGGEDVFCWSLQVFQNPLSNCRSDSCWIHSWAMRMLLWLLTQGGQPPCISLPPLTWGSCPCFCFLAPVSDPKAATGLWVAVCCSEGEHVAHDISDLPFWGTLASFTFPI